MKQLAEGLLPVERPPVATRSTCTSSGGVLIDAATRQAERRILRQLEGPHGERPNKYRTSQAAYCWHVTAAPRNPIRSPILRCRSWYMDTGAECRIHAAIRGLNKEAPTAGPPSGSCRSWVCAAPFGTAAGHPKRRRRRRCSPSPAISASVTRTLLTHLSAGVNMISRGRAAALQRVTPKALRADILGALTPEPLIVADRHRAGPTIDAEVKMLLLLPPGTETTGASLAYERDLADGRLFRAVRPGNRSGERRSGAWAGFVRIAPEGAMSVSPNIAIWRRTRMSKSKARCAGRPS